MVSSFGVTRVQACTRNCLHLPIGIEREFDPLTANLSSPCVLWPRQASRRLQPSDGPPSQSDPSIHPHPVLTTGGNGTARIEGHLWTERGQGSCGGEALIAGDVNQGLGSNPWLTPRLSLSHLPLSTRGEGSGYGRPALAVFIKFCSQLVGRGSLSLEGGEEGRKEGGRRGCCAGQTSKMAAASIAASKAAVSAQISLAQISKVEQRRSTSSAAFRKTVALSSGQVHVWNVCLVYMCLPQGCHCGGIVLFV